MPLWGSTDNAANSPMFTAMQYNKTTNANSQNQLYGNTTANVVTQNMTVGVFGVNINEEAANPQITHSGWNIRKVGSGLRAGRVTYECLVAAGGNFGIPDGADSVTIGDYAIVFNSNPVANAAQTNQTVTFSVNAVTRPAGGTITYQWYANGTSITNGGVYSGATTNTLSVVLASNVNNAIFTVGANVSNAVANVVSTGATLRLLP